MNIRIESLTSVNLDNVIESLMISGFVEDCLVFKRSDLTVTIDEKGILVNVPIELSDHDVTKETITRMLLLPNFGNSIIKWDKQYKQLNYPGFTSDKSESEEWSGKTSNRPLTVYTWGNALSRAPVDVDNDYSALSLNGRNEGINLATQDGRNESIQKVVSQCSGFKQFIERIVHDVETNDYKAISIHCSMGRHRSVAAAELLKKMVYPNAKIVHTRWEYTNQ